MKRRRLGRLGAQLLATVIVLAPLAASAAEGHGGGAPHINWWSWDMHAPPVGWFLVDFAAFVAALVYFTRRPLRDAFARRHFAVRRAIEENEAALALARSRYEETRDKLARVEREVNQLILRVKEDGASERDRIIASARAYAARLLEDSTVIVAQEGAAARERLRRSVAERALRTAERMLMAAITEADRTRLIDEAIGEIEKVEALSATQRRRAQGHSSTGGDAVGGIE